MSKRKYARDRMREPTSYLAIAGIIGFGALVLMVGDIDAFESAWFRVAMGLAFLLCVLGLVMGERGQ